MGWVLFLFHLQRPNAPVEFDEVRERTWLGFFLPPAARDFRQEKSRGRVGVEEHIPCHKGAYTGKSGITRDRTGKPWYYRNLKR